MSTSNQQIKYFNIALGTLLLVFIPLLALGSDLHEAKKQGLLGERPDGYVGLVKPSSNKKTVKLMKEINRKRREVYKGIAKKNGTALSAVEALAGKKAIKKTPSGQFIMQSDGTWAPKP